MRKQEMSKKNLHHIKNMEELRAEIVATKAGIKLRERELAERWQQAPSEAVKTAAGAVVSTFLSKKIAVQGFELVKTATQKMFGKKGDEAAKNKSDIFSSAKKIGFYAALGLLLNWYKKKK